MIVGSSGMSFQMQAMRFMDALNTAGNTFPDENNEVLIAPDIGDVSGTINVQVLRGGDGLGNDVQKRLRLLALVCSLLWAMAMLVAAPTKVPATTMRPRTTTMALASKKTNVACVAGSGIAEGACDCDGNVLDECGVCGGDGIAEGACDCDGNVLDECGVCGGEGIAEGRAIVKAMCWMSAAFVEGRHCRRSVRLCRQRT